MKTASCAESVHWRSLQRARARHAGSARRRRIYAATFWCLGTVLAIISQYINRVPRRELTETDRVRGRALGQALVEARGSRSTDSVARASGVVVDTLRAIERGSVASPGLFVIAAVSRELGLSLDQIVVDVTRRVDATPTNVAQS